MNLTKGQPVNKIDKNIHDKVAHFRVEFGTISTVNLTYFDIEL